jgi:predicted dehydrogenase
MTQTPLMTAISLSVPRPDGWRNDPVQMGGDMFADIGSHEVDVLLWLAGAPPAAVAAFTADDHPAHAAILSAQAKLTNGAITSITFNDNVALGDEFAFQGNGSLMVYGDMGVLTAEWSGFGATDVNSIWLEKKGVRQQIVIEGETISPAAAFITSVLDGAPNIAPVDDAAQVVAFIQSAYLSAREGRIVPIE